MRQHFYHATTRMYMTAFAALFDGVFCTTEGGDLTPVPLMYANKQKFLEIIDADEDKLVTNFETTLPRLAYEMTGMNYAPERMNNPLHILSRPGALGSSYNRMPYDFTFSLYAATKQFDDMLEITVQIIPMFTPDFTIAVKERVGDMIFDTNLTTVLNSVSFNVDNVGSFEDLRRIESSMNFTLKGYLYPRVGRFERIKEAIVNLYSYPPDTLLQINKSVVDPRTAEQHEPHLIREEVIDARPDQ